MSKPVRLRPFPAPRGPRVHALARIGAIILLLFIFLLGVKGLGDGFKLLGRDLLDAFFRATENPFMGLMVGILATSLVQSSSVTTSMIVGFVAAPDNPLPIANAIPMIMGANIGTTVTNTLVSLAHIGRKEEFRRAFAAATCHDFFNYMTVAILLPLELATGYLRKSAHMLAVFLVEMGTGGVKYESPIKGALHAGFTPFNSFAAWLFDSDHGRAAVLILISGVLIFISLLLLVRVLRGMLQNRVESGLMRVLEKVGALSILVGVAVTVMVQSSSITTSLLVPLAGAGVITLEQVFPITIGANIGTTVTALLASLALSGENALAGITIALVHFLFNLSGTILIYPIPAIRNIPLMAARGIARVAIRSRAWAIGYVFILFYGIPAVAALIDLSWS